MDVDVYIDVVFLVNFLMDMVLLYLLKTFLKRPSAPWRIVLGGAWGGALACLEVLMWQAPGWLMMMASLGGAVGMIEIAYRPKGVREAVKETGSLYFLAVVTGGLMEILYGYTRAGFYVFMVAGGSREFVLPLLLWLLLAAGACLLAVGMAQFAREMMKERNLMYLVILSDGDVKVESTGYLDTGNCLKEPESGGEVQIVTERIWNTFAREGKKKVMIPYHTVGNPYGEMTGMQIERMEICGIKGHGKKGRMTIDDPWIAKAPYGLTGDKRYEVLLHGETTMAEGHREGGITSGD